MSHREIVTKLVELAEYAVLRKERELALALVKIALELQTEWEIK